jgi:hypothetical protein
MRKVFVMILESLLKKILNEVFAFILSRKARFSQLHLFESSKNRQNLKEFYRIIPLMNCSFINSKSTIIVNFFENE